MLPLNKILRIYVTEKRQHRDIVRTDNPEKYLLRLMYVEPSK